MDVFDYAERPFHAGPTATRSLEEKDDGEWPADTGARRRSLQYGLIDLLSAFLASQHQPPLQWGINLFSAQVLVSAVACILLLRNLRRLL